jgi:hypothetical protein
MTMEGLMQDRFDAYDAAQRDEIVADARRYRWLKEHHLQLGPDCWIRTGEDLDEAIDAEMREAHKSDSVKE